MTKTAISLSKLSFSYDHTSILENISLRIPQGSFVGIIGPNGGGKTTLLKLLMGFLIPTKGTISLFNETPVKARTRIGYVPQFHRFDKEFPITVEEIVLLGALSKASLFGIYPKSVRAQALELLKEFDLLKHAKKTFGSLSGGMAQKALLARALLSDPDLLLLDEPTANIDAPTSLAILDKLERLKGKKTILLVTHDLKTVAEKVDQVLCVQQGVTSYLPEEICKHFAFGLYHTPLIDQQITLTTQKPHAPVLISQ